MKAKLLIILSILLIVADLAHGQEKPKIIVTDKPPGREFITPGTMPKEILIKPNTLPKRITVDPGLVGTPATDLDFTKDEKGEIKITIKEREIRFRPANVQKIGGEMPEVKVALTKVFGSKVYPVIKETMGQIDNANIEVVKYDKQEFELLYIPVVRGRKPADSFIGVYKFAKQEKVVLYQLHKEKQIEMIDGTTGEKIILNFTDKGQLISSILIPKTPWLSFLLASKAYALEWKEIKDCIGAILKEAKDWIPTCASCVISKFKGPTCKLCIYQFMGIAGECIQKLSPK